MKRIIPIIIAVLLLAFVFYKLKSNKEELQAQTNLSLKKVEEIPVRVHMVAASSTTFTDKYSGQLVAESDLMVTSSAQGRVTNVFVKKGDKIKQGDVIAQVEDVLQREQVQVTKTVYEKLKKDEERFRIMAENDAITGQQLEALELNLKAAEAKYLAAQQQLADNRVKSPISGIINQLFVKKGSMLGPGVPVCELVNTDNILLRLKLSQQELEKLTSSDRIDVQIDGGVEMISGSIAFQSVKPDFANLFEVDIVMNDSKIDLLPGMLATAVTSSEPNGEEILIPQISLLGYGESEFYVFVVIENRAEKRIVKPGDSSDGWIKILDGISIGDRVIIEGQSIIDSGQKISVQQ
jgi:RND family efflux transporter MFP subunit